MKRRKGSVVVFSCLLVALSFFSIGIGAYFNYLSKPKNIISVGIYSLKDKIDNYFYSDFDTILNYNNFSVNSDIDFELSSEYYQKRLNIEENKKKYNFINNLDKMDTSILLQHDKKNSKLLFQIDEEINKEKILDYKYYIDNSTEYYFVNNVVNNYVNNGNGNYFEILNEENTLKTNIDYLYSFIIESFLKNLDDSYFKKYSLSQKIDGKNMNVNQISIRLTNKNVREILNNILKDLKEDDRSNKILSSIYRDFNDYKIKDNVKYFDKNESYTINIYTTKFLYKPLKYEVIYLNNDEKKSYIYEGDKTNGNLYFLDGDTVVHMVDYTDDGNTMLFKIYGSTGKDEGEFKLEHSNDNINYTYDDGSVKYDFIYNSKNSDVNKSGYKNTRSLTFRVVEDKESKVNGTITMNTVVGKNTHIDEDIDNAILASKLTTEQKNRVDTLKEQIKERLENR